jgi:ATP-dependent RNA helicase DDX35
MQNYRLKLLYTLETNAVTLITGNLFHNHVIELMRFMYQSNWTRNGQCLAYVSSSSAEDVNDIAKAAANALTSSTRLGDLVGMRAPFESQFSSTRSKFMYYMDVCFLQDILYDPLLKRYRVIILDACNVQSSMYIDVILGLVKKIQIKRKDLKLVVLLPILSSRKEDEPKLLSFFKYPAPSKPTIDVKLIHLSSCPFPITIQYKDKPCLNYIDGMVDTILKIHANESPGNILAFLPGYEEIKETIKSLKDIYEGTDLVYVNLERDGGKDAKHHSNAKQSRRVFLSTSAHQLTTRMNALSCAYIVDSGFTKIHFFDFHASTTYSITKEESQQTARQRSSIVGAVSRTNAKTFRLMTEVAFKHLSPTEIPEMERADISSLVLRLKSLGIDDIFQFDFPNPPSTALLIFAIENLHSLKAIDAEGNLTIDGKKMAEIPLDPRWGRVLLNSMKEEFYCTQEAIAVTATCWAVERQKDTIFTPVPVHKRKEFMEGMRSFVDPLGDHASYVNALNDFEGLQDDQEGYNYCREKFLRRDILSKAKKCATMLKSILFKLHPDFDGAIPSNLADMTFLSKCILTGFFAQVAKQHNDGYYYPPNGQRRLSLHPSSVLMTSKVIQPEWVVYNRIVHETGGGHGVIENGDECYIQDVSAIDPKWLIDDNIAGHYYTIR